VRHHRRVDADRADGKLRVCHPERFQDVVPHRVSGLGAEPFDATFGVVSGERGEVDAADRL